MLKVKGKVLKFAVLSPICRRGSCNNRSESKRQNEMEMPIKKSQFDFLILLCYNNYNGKYMLFYRSAPSRRLSDCLGNSYYSISTGFYIVMKKTWIFFSFPQKNFPTI